MIVLSTTIHDPEGGLAWLSEKHLGMLRQLFDAIVLVASPATNHQYLHELREQGVHVHQLEENTIGQVYYDAIRYALDGDTTPDHVFYCDFDRILHWVHTFADELASFVQYLRTESQDDYIVCERSERAYASHHGPLYETEKIPNMVISHAVGANKTRDFLSGSYVMSRKAARLAVEMGAYDGWEHFGSWPVLMYDNAFQLSYFSFDGLEWETPDRFQGDVKRAGGLDAWREERNTASEWLFRTTMAQSIVSFLLKYER